LKNKLIFPQALINIFVPTRIEVITCIMTLKRLDKGSITDGDLKTANYIRKGREAKCIPPLRDDIKSATPPPTPRTDRSDRSDSTMADILINRLSPEEQSMDEDGAASDHFPHPHSALSAKIKASHPQIQIPTIEEMQRDRLLTKPKSKSKHTLPSTPSKPKVKPIRERPKKVDEASQLDFD
jgi:hypothetical protein